MKFVNINYDKAHSVVESRKNLMWDGWDIVEYKYDADAMHYVNARFINGKWAKVNIYKPSNNGWRVPEKYGI